MICGMTSTTRSDTTRVVLPVCVPGGRQVALRAAKIQEFLFPRVSKISASEGEVPFLAGNASPTSLSQKGVNCGCLTRHKDPEREDA